MTQTKILKKLKLACADNPTRYSNLLSELIGPLEKIHKLGLGGTKLPETDFNGLLVDCINEKVRRLRTLKETADKIEKPRINGAIKDLRNLKYNITGWDRID